LENEARHIKNLCDKAKNGIKESCNNALEAAKERGIEVLGKMASFFNVREYYENIEAKAQNTIDRCEKTIEQIEAFSKEYHKVGNALKNLGRIILGKEPEDKAAEIGNLAKKLCAPYRNSINNNTQIRDNAAESIKALDRLSERAETIHEKRAAKKPSYDDRMASAKEKTNAQENKTDPSQKRDNRDER
jgi:predicted nuclease with TOPRIM domain